jgi:hypothetical protein
MEFKKANLSMYPFIYLFFGDNSIFLRHIDLFSAPPSLSQKQCGFPRVWGGGVEFARTGKFPILELPGNFPSRRCAPIYSRVCICRIFDTVYAPFTLKIDQAFFLQRTVSELFLGAIEDEALKKKPIMIPSKARLIGDIGAYSVDRQTS